jgi:DNA-binding transcriptional regulator GbsR (MarR family)
MAQIHALLMLAPEPLSVEDIMEALNISRGNVSMNLRSLMDWGIVRKEYKAGERKEYFASEKDVWKLSTQVAKERRKRELEPVIDMLNMAINIKVDKKDPEQKEFLEMSNDLLKFANQSDSILKKFINADRNFFFKTIIRFFK